MTTGQVTTKSGKGASHGVVTELSAYFTVKPRCQLLDEETTEEKQEIVYIFLRKEIYDIRLELARQSMRIDKWTLSTRSELPDLPAYKKPYLKVGHCGV